MALPYLLQWEFVDGIDGSPNFIVLNPPPHSQLTQQAREDYAKITGPEDLIDAEDLVEKAPSTFHLFPRLPFELRIRILKMALGDTHDVVLVHPNNDEGITVPPLFQVSYETRLLAKSVYTLHRGNHIGKDFVAYINFASDSIYINCNFRVNGTRFPSGLHATTHAYPQMLVCVESLCMNLCEMTRLTSAYRISNRFSTRRLWDLWEMLDKECPNLSRLFAILNGPFPHCYGLKLVQLNNQEKRYWSRCTSPVADVMENYLFLKWTLKAAQGDGLCKRVGLGQAVEEYSWKGSYL